MKILCVFGQHQYGDRSRGLGTEYRAFVPALQRAEHEVMFFESWDRDAYADFAALNVALLQTIERERPEVMLFVPFLGEVWLETLQVIKARGDVISICWTTDDSWKYRQQSRYIASAFDVITTTYSSMVPEYRRDGTDHVFLTQWAASFDELAAPLPAAKCRYDVTFVGAMHGNRRRYVEMLAKSGIEVRCFGHGWPNGPVSAAEMNEIIRTSSISLNFANSQGANQIKARTFEIPGAGGFLLSGAADGLERYYVIGTEIDTFHDAAELRQQITCYLGNPDLRDAMAVRAYERTRTEHTYDVRLKELLAFAAQTKRAAEQRPNVTLSLADACRKHRVKPWHRAFRALLVGVTSAIWGRRRGRRAARRLVYELSWRLFGARTYSAAGLPGRLFPKD